MANTFRYRRGETRPVFVAVDPATVIEIGDLLWLDTDDAKPASSQADCGSEVANLGAFHGNFLGVAEQQSRDGDTQEIRVATIGVFEMDCPSATYEVGDLIVACENADGDGLLDQTVQGGAIAYAIGRVVNAEAIAVTKVLVQIESTVMTGGPQDPVS